MIVIILPACLWHHHHSMCYKSAPIRCAADDYFSGKSSEPVLRTVAREQNHGDVLHDQV